MLPGDDYETRTNWNNGIYSGTAAAPIGEKSTMCDARQFRNWIFFPFSFGKINPKVNQEVISWSCDEYGLIRSPCCNSIEIRWSFLLITVNIRVFVRLSRLRGVHICLWGSVICVQRFRGLVAAWDDRVAESVVASRGRRPNRSTIVN